MTGSLDIVVLLRRFAFRRAAASAGRAAAACSAAEAKLSLRKLQLKEALGARHAAAKVLGAGGSARLLANLVSYDRRLSCELAEVEDGIRCAEEDLSKRRGMLADCLRELADAQARIRVVENVRQQRRQASWLRCERQQEEEVIDAWCAHKSALDQPYLLRCPGSGQAV